jgi:hypothetical protein
MPTSTSPDRTAPVTLRVEADNPAAEVFLLDPQLQLVARGVGALVTRQIPGVYKIRVRLGRESMDKLILLGGDATESITAPVFASPAPLETTSLTHEYHIAAAETHSAQPTVVLGDGASIFVFARYFTPPEQQARVQEHPARDLSLRHLDGTLLVDLASASITGSPPDAWAACHVRLTPGAYVFQYQAPQGPLAHSVIASPGWQTQVFLMRSQPAADRDTAEGRAAPTGIFDMATVLMSSDPFSSRSSALHLTELARIALADERPILSGALRDLLTQKFRNPMQGIFGAHLMLLARDRANASPRQSNMAKPTTVPDPEPPFDPQLFDVVVSNLRSLVGTTHPDVEALSLQCSDPADRAQAVFTVPPMLRRSWSLIVEASNDRPDILDPILWDRVITRTMSAPFLSWFVVSDNVREQLQESMREVVESREQMRDQEPRSPAAAFDLPSSGASSDDFRRSLSRDLDMPRRAVDRMLGGQ